MKNDDKVDVNKIIDEIKMPPNLKDIYEKAIISGMRIMFSPDSHEAFLVEVNKPGAMDDKLANGIIGLVYMLWDKSNKTLPPQIMVPITVTLLLKAFDFLQLSGNPEGTKEVLGSAMEKALEAILSKFNVTPQQIEQIVNKQKGLIGSVQNA